VTKDCSILSEFRFARAWELERFSTCWISSTGSGSSAAACPSPISVRSGKSDRVGVLGLDPQTVSFETVVLRLNESYEFVYALVAETDCNDSEMASECGIAVVDRITSEVRNSDLELASVSRV